MNTITESWVAVEPPLDRASFPRDKGNILIIEDDVDVRQLLGQVLALQGYQVYLARDGQEAMRAFEELGSELDLILLDLLLPVMNGWDFMAALEHDARMRSVPIIVTSATDRKDAPLGALAFLRKPIDLQNLLILVRHICGGPREAEPSPEWKS